MLLHLCLWTPLTCVTVSGLCSFPFPLSFSPFDVVFLISSEACVWRGTWRTWKNHVPNSSLSWNLEKTMKKPGTWQQNVYMEQLTKWPSWASLLLVLFLRFLKHDGFKTKSVFYPPKSVFYPPTQSHPIAKLSRGYLIVSCTPSESMFRPSAPQPCLFTPC